jgi:5'-nucleotidase
MRHLPWRHSPPRCIRVRQTLRLDGVAAIGLDLDHTLATYDDSMVNELAFAETCRFLVQDKGYPEAISSFRYRDAEACRGLVVDLRHGNLLKLDYRDRVRRARHGRRPLEAFEIRGLYGRSAIAIEQAGYPAFDSPFDLPAARLFSLAVDLERDLGDRIPDYRALFCDILEALDQSHTRGALKLTILSNPGRFVTAPAGVAASLERLRSAGFKLFLLTNSGYEYTCGLMDHLLKGWREVFGLAATGARKPAFFTAGTSPRPIDVRSAGATVWEGGSASGLTTILGVTPDRICFVGDNPTHDCRAARAAHWRTAMVIPELLKDIEGEAQRLAGGTVTRDEWWGPALWEGKEPTRFQRFACDYAEAVAPDLVTLLESAQGGMLPPR